MLFKLTSIGFAALSIFVLSPAAALTGPDGDFGLVFRNLLAAPPTGALGHGGNVRPAFSSNWPALKGAGVGIVTLQLEPNATHLPHWHRGSELLFVINGNLTVGISSFNTSIGVIEYNLTNGDAVIIENAAAHHVHNRGPGRSINLSAFSNDNPGTQLSAKTLFDFSDNIIQDAIQVDSATIGKIRSASVATPGLYDGLSEADQRASPLGNFTQALGSATSSLDASAQSISVSTAG